MDLIKLNKKGNLFHFFIKSLFFIFILFILDLSIGKLLNYLYFNQGSGSLYDITYSLDSTKADIIIIGSSTAHHNYYPESFKKKFGMTYYNTGNDGTSLLYHFAILKSILKRYSPKIVILDFSIKEFRKDDVSYDRLSILLPYYYTNPGLQQILNLKSKFEKEKLFSKIYPFNSMIFSVVSRNSLFNKYNAKRKRNEEGYIPSFNIWNQPIQTDISNLQYELDSNKINFFKSFVRECKAANVDLYIVAAPRFIKYIHKDTSVKIAIEIADSNNIPFYNFLRDTTFLNHQNFFSDNVHMNNIGVKTFSDILIDTILKNKEYTRINDKRDFSIK